MGSSCLRKVNWVCFGVLLLVFFCTTESTIIDINFADSLEFFSHNWIGANAGDIRYVQDKHMIKSLNLVQAAGFRYVRLENIIKGTGFCFLKDGDVHYSWDLFDELVDTIYRVGFWPIIVLEPMDFLDLAGETLTVQEKLTKWQKVVKDIVNHCREKWGNDVDRWYFEVCNAPDKNAAYKGNINTYLQVYDYTAAAVEEADTQVRIGGPSVEDLKWLEIFLEHCTQGINYATQAKGSRVDFIGIQMYAVQSGRPMFNSLDEKLNAVKTMMRDSDLEDFSLFVTSWSCSESPYIGHDQPYDAAFRAMAVKKFIENGVKLAVVNSLTENMDSDFEGFRGATGLFTRGTIPKPSFRVFQLLNGVIGKKVAFQSSDGQVDGLAVMSYDNNRAWILLYSASESFARRYTTPVVINLENLPQGTWRAQLTKIDGGTVDPLSKWRQLGSPRSIPNNIAEEIMLASELPQSQPLNLENKTITIEMPSQAVYFIEMFRGK